MMESRETLKFEPKLFVAIIIGACLLYVVLTQDHGIRLALSLYVYIVLVISTVYFGRQFLRIMFAPLMSIIIVIVHFQVKRFIKQFPNNKPADIVIFLAHPDWRTLEGWIKPNYLKYEIVALVEYLKSTGHTFSFFPHATFSDVEKIMRDTQVKEVGFYGHGNSHEFCLSNDLTIFYCDFNSQQYLKQYVHQFHCGTREGKSLVDYVVPPENRSKCFFFRKSITGPEIVKDLKQRIKQNKALA